MYFEFNIPTKRLPYMTQALSQKFSSTAKSVERRMKKLNEALSKAAPMRGEDFARCAKILFDNAFERFEKMTALQLAKLVKSIDDGQRLPERYEWPNATVVVDTAFLTRTEWETLRHYGIGGSDAATVMGVNPYGTKQTLYHDKCGTEYKIASPSKAAIFERGHFMEDKVVEAFCKLTGAKVIPETRMFASAEYPHCTANIDAIVLFPDGRMYIFEAKTTIEDNFSAWANNKIPHNYLKQCIHYPAVLNDPRICGTYIGCLLTNDSIVGNTYIGSLYDISNFFVREVERFRDDELEQLELCEKFYVEQVETNNEPQPAGISKADGKKSGISDLDIQRRLAGPADTTAPVLSLSLREHETEINEWLALNDRRKQLDKQSDAIKARQEQLSLSLTKELGRSVKAEIPIDADSFYEVKYRPNMSRKAVDLEKLQIAFPEAFSQCYKPPVETSRVFSISMKKYSKAKKAV